MGDEGVKLFTGRLPTDITEEELKYVFQTYGNVTDVRVHDKEGSSGVKSAFVVYETRQAADAAIKVLHEVYKFREDALQPITVHPAKSRDRGGRGGDRGPPMDYGGYGGEYREYDRKGGCKGGCKGGGKGYDRFDRGPPPMHDRGYDRGYDRFDRGPERFDRGGYDRYDRFDRGDPRMALYDRGYDRPRSRDPRRGPPPMKGKGKGKEGAPGNKLYVANLPEDITPDAIDYVFANYGRVADIFLMTGKSKGGRIAAFITYERDDSARKCILAMDQGYEIRPGQGHILVKYADDQRPTRQR